MPAIGKRQAIDLLNLTRLIPILSSIKPGVLLLLIRFLAGIHAASDSPLSGCYPFPGPHARLTLRTTKGPFERFQYLLQHTFNILLNQMSRAFEQVVRHCRKRKNMLKACWKRVESNLNWFKTFIIVD